MGRKRNQGKARRAAKAKAREEAEDGANNNQASLEQSMAARMRQLQIGEGGEKCDHGYHTAYKRDFDPFSSKEEFLRFMSVFCGSLFEAVECGDRSLPDCLIAARDASMEEFADLWKDSTKLEIVMSYFLYVGTVDLLEGDYMNACKCTTLARYFEQHIAVELKQTQALMNWPKICEIYYGDDDHALVKFLRHRIPCSCLDKMYEEVKHVTKMGICWNPQCSIPGKKVERSKAKYCSRCRCATYCSRQCQEAAWEIHKPVCDDNFAVIAEFEEKRQK